MSINIRDGQGQRAEDRKPGSGSAGLCKKHVQSPAVVLDEALRRVVVWNDAGCGGSSTAGVSRS